MSSIAIIDHNIEESEILANVLKNDGIQAVCYAALADFIKAWQISAGDVILFLSQENFEGLEKAVQAIQKIAVAPLVLVTNQLIEEEQVALLRLGIDALIQRPYSIRVLLEIMRNYLRRGGTIPMASLPVLSRDGLIFNPETRIVSGPKTEKQRLSLQEGRLLHTLMVNAGQPLRSEELARHVWNFTFEEEHSLVRGIIRRLRKKIEPDPAHPRYIRTAAPFGYVFGTLRR